jgi:hypothetical protein
MLDLTPPRHVSTLRQAAVADRRAERSHSAGAGTGFGLRPALAVADEPRSGGACTAEVRGSNPLRSTRKSPRIALVSRRPQYLDYLVRCVT